MKLQSETYRYIEIHFHKEGDTTTASWHSPQNESLSIADAPTKHQLMPKVKRIIDHQYELTPWNIDADHDGVPDSVDCEPLNPHRQDTRNFKSEAAYKRWLAYGHMHGDFAKTPGHQKIKIKGKPHKVVHSR